MTIAQTTAKMAADWQTFSIGAGNSVTINQPSATSAALNRVLGADIQGALKANGQVFLINPNGALLTPTAQVSVGGLVASTLNLKTEDFPAGKYNFDSRLCLSYKGHSIINQGNITAIGDGSVGGKGGSIALIAAKITNTGTLTANAGSVLLGAGTKVTLDLGGPIKLQVTQGAIDALIESGDAIQANGGTVLLTARAAGDLASSVINLSGIIEACSLSDKGFTVVLEADHITLAADSKIEAKGASGGGLVLFGDSYQNSDASVYQATTVARGASIDVSATQTTSGIVASTLQTNLGGGGKNSIATSATVNGADMGDIKVNSAVAWGGNTLSLSAHNNTNVKAALNGTGTIALSLTSNTAGGSGTGSYVIGSTSNFAYNRSVQTFITPSSGAYTLNAW